MILLINKKFLEKEDLMTEHTLTRAQVRRFIGAVGCTSEPQLIIGNNFSTEQLRTMAEEHGGLVDLPMFTDDPQLNFVIDCVMADDDDQPEWSEEEYEAEIKEAKRDGLLSSV